MHPLQRRLYRLLVHLHPPQFRGEFAREMELDFEEAFTAYGFARLLLDAMRSLARQWMAPVFAPHEQETAIPLHPLLAGQYVAIGEYTLTPLQLARGSALFVVLLFVLGLAADMANHQILGNTQKPPTSQEAGLGYVDSGAGNQSSEGETVSHSRMYAGMGSRVSSRHGRARYGETGEWGPERGTPILVAGLPWRILLLECAIASAIVWLTSFLLRRSRSVRLKVAFVTLGFLAVATTVALLTFHLPVARAQNLQSGSGPTEVTPVQGQLLHGGWPLPSFEVATVRLRPSTPPPAPPPVDGIRPAGPAKLAPGRGGAQTTDHVHQILPARMLIAFAYNVPVGFEGSRILGGPAWLDSDVYDIQAKIDDTTFADMQTLSASRQRDRVQLMEQALLADRFQFKAHSEIRELPGYTLSLAKGGAKLAPAQPGETTRLAMQGDTMIATALTVDQWIHSPFLGGRVIVDQTGLTGAYDFTLTYSNRTDVAGDDPNGVPALSTAVQEQLGLKLVPTKALVEVLVIDHIERPTEN